MRELGIIKLVQIQRTRLKQGEKPDRYFDPSPLLVVDKLHLTHEGIVGVSPEGYNYVDVHNANHHLSANRGDNGVSIGFTPHYDAMRERYGTHLKDGIGGENIIIETDEPIRLNQLGKRLAIKSQATGTLTYLDNTMVADPCVEFSRFCTQDPTLAGAEMKETLQFLGDGRRGFYCTWADDKDHAVPVICAGDTLLVID